MAGKRKNFKFPKPPSVNDIQNSKFGLVLSWAMKIFVSTLIMYFAYMVGQRVANVIVARNKKNAQEHTRLIVHQLSEVAFYVIILVGVFFAVINLGVQTASIVTLMGTMLVTIGLALQSILANIFSGVSVALADNFRIGDVIKIYLPWVREPFEGRVEDLNIAYVMLKDEQTGKIVYIPNASVATNVFINMSRNRPV